MVRAHLSEDDNQPLTEKINDTIIMEVSFVGVSPNESTKINAANPNQQAVEKCHKPLRTLRVQNLPNKRLGSILSNAFLVKISL
ncbi:hypothetical protein [Pseudoalteromonas luteoviolacea]|uniref:hypothetical protein n=1 Tax=Pseudoalteromonas luteoviolacea TaxID=43657 RepID=UPI0012DA8A62|nr:hypothetical protein [Pseudoalteromonas luteoviolacea]MBE0385895.1 hypothetical protein [Pseudoalteromonas luteoviolacea DSM 6061]